MNIVSISHNSEGWWRNKYITDFDAWTFERDVNLALIGLKLRKYVELWDFTGNAIAYQRRSLISTIASLHLVLDSQHQFLKVHTSLFYRNLLIV